MREAKDFTMLANCEHAPLNEISVHPFETWCELIANAVNSEKNGARICAMPVLNAPKLSEPLIFAVLAFPHAAELGIIAAPLPKSPYPSLTLQCHAAHWFERELAENYDLTPQNHPWLKPIRFSKNAPQIGHTNFLAAQGTESHEVAVGPVHAGVIEPGHFRFLCHGETVEHLEISLGYQHRGIEKALLGGPNARTVHYIQNTAGDTSIGHATAYCRAIESLSSVFVSPRCEAIRAIAAELERVANHIGDLGALAGDVGFLPTMNYCGRIRGDVLNMTAILCGNRFGKNLLCEGGLEHDLSAADVEDLSNRAMNVERDITSAVDLMFETPSVLARFEGTGTLTHDDAKRIGLVGVAARACGCETDVRFEFPYGMYSLAQLPVSTWATGDCFARAYVRWMELTASLVFIKEQLDSLPGGNVFSHVPKLAPKSFVASLVEGWRGEICHVAITDDSSHFAAYKIVDPSFHNWFGLALALRGQEISDFPLCNKSFNLSYCGHDL